MCYFSFSSFQVFRYVCRGCLKWEGQGYHILAGNPTGRERNDYGSRQLIFTLEYVSTAPSAATMSISKLALFHITRLHACMHPPSSHGTAFLSRNFQLTKIMRCERELREETFHNFDAYFQNELEPFTSASLPGLPGVKKTYTYY